MSNKKASGAEGVQQRMAPFARDELHLLVTDLQRRLRFKTTAPDLVGALILAARQLPLEVVRELLPAYNERENALTIASPDESA